MLSIGAFARLGQVSPRMLRHYDEIGLLVPHGVDGETGYRSYDVGQLAQLHRLLALRDLGFSLEQIRPLLDGGLSLQELRGMLRLRRSQIEQHVVEEQDRLRRVEAHLRALEGSKAVTIQNVVIKPTEPIRIAEAVGIAPGYGNENLGPLFAQLLPLVLDHLRVSNARPGISVGHYEGPADDGSVVLHAGFEIGDQEVQGTDDVNVIELPVVEVASVVHRGPMNGIKPTFDDLIRWIEDSGYRWIDETRELYLEFHQDPTRHVTELQVPLIR